jgi:hypothetical protein
MKPLKTPTPRQRRHARPMMLAAAAVGLLLVAVGTSFAVFGLRSSPAPVAPQAAAPVPPPVPTVPAAPSSKPTAPATPTPAYQHAADQQAADRLAASRQAEAQRFADEAAARERAQAAEAAAEDARANAEPNEIALKMTNRDRQKLQVALQTLGFDAGGIAGDFGPRSRQNIAAWQTKNGDVATGFVTAAQRATLLADGAAAIAKWEDQQRRAWAEEQRRARAEEQRRLQVQQQTPPPPKPGFRWPWQ